jgi:hypothetical protein
VAYIADASRIRAGSIVKVEKPLSSSGQFTYPHFFVVLSAPDKPQIGDLFVMIGVSSRINSDSADPAKHVAMKWLDRKGGDPETGFDRPSFACADFVCIQEAYDGEEHPIELAVEFRGKFVRPGKLQTLIALMNAWNGRPNR